MSGMHFWWFCKQCRRYVTGCPQSCPYEHIILECECCAMCARKADRDDG